MLLATNERVERLNETIRRQLAIIRLSVLDTEIGLSCSAVLAPAFFGMKKRCDQLKVRVPLPPLAKCLTKARKTGTASRANAR